MARTPKKKGDRVVVYPKQWPDTRVDKPVIDRDDSVTPHLGHEYRLTKKFSEQSERPKDARETFSKRFRFTRAKHMPHPAPIKGGHYKTTPQMEKPHYEEHDTQMGNKSYTQFVTEAAKRGRPRKLRPGEEADTLHIQDQLNKLTHPNHVEVHFKDGSKHRIPREHANMALHHLNSLKPIERADHAEHMAKSHNDFYHVLSKKSIPEKKKGISLAGPKLRKEEVEQIDEVGDTKKGRRALADYIKKAGGAGMDSVGGLMYQAGGKDARDPSRVDLFKTAGKRARGVERAVSRLAKEEADHDDDGWYAHKEMHGSKAISKEDWKKGVRPKKSMKKEDVEQVDELKMSHGTYVSAMQRTTGHDAGSEEGRVDAKKLVARAKKYKGAKFAKDLEGAHGMAERPHRNKTMGQIASDKLAWRSPSKATASGTANKNLLKSLKGSLTKGDYRKPSLPKRKLPEEVEQIDEWGQSKKAITGPHAKTSTMAITPPKVGYKGKQKKPKVQELTREEAAPKTSFKKMKASLMSKANREKDASN